MDAAQYEGDTLIAKVQPTPLRVEPLRVLPPPQVDHQKYLRVMFPRMDLWRDSPPTFVWATSAELEHFLRAQHSLYVATYSCMQASLRGCRQDFHWFRENCIIIEINPLTRQMRHTRAE